MSENISMKKFTRDVTVSVMAQILSLMTSFVLGFIVPKFIDEYQYAYWQQYVLYVTYVGLLHFGLLDGFILRYSQWDLDTLDKPRVRSQLHVLLVMMGTFCLVGLGISTYFLEGVTAGIFALVALSIVTKNVFTYASYTFQMTNRIRDYALLLVVQRLMYAVAVVVFLLLGKLDFYWYCIADLIGDVLGVLALFRVNKEMYLGRGLKLRESLSEAWKNLSSGISLLLANFAATFILSGAKLVVQWGWEDLTFGKVAFAFQVMILFSTFISSVSVVLFPSLKRLNPQELPDLYTKIRKAISPVLFVVLFGYFPVCVVLRLWLPAYAESLRYLGILLPVVIFTSKGVLLANNYLKAYRKEREMFIINLVSVILGMSLELFGAFVLKNLDVVLYTVVLISFGNALASEMVVMKTIQKQTYREIFGEFVMTLIFLALVRWASFSVAMVGYLLALLVYAWMYRESVRKMLRR